MVPQSLLGYKYGAIDAQYTCNELVEALECVSQWTVVSAILCQLVPLGGRPSPVWDWMTVRSGEAKPLRGAKSWNRTQLVIQLGARSSPNWPPNGSNRATKAIGTIGNLSNRSNYEWTEQDAQKIVRELRKAVKEVENSFLGDKGAAGGGFVIKP